MVKKIRDLTHAVSVDEALELGNTLESLSAKLRDKVQRITIETSGQKREADNLLERAKNVR